MLGHQEVFERVKELGVPLCHWGLALGFQRPTSGPVSLSVSVSVSLSLCVCVYVCVCLSVCLSVCLCLWIRISFQLLLQLHACCACHHAPCHDDNEPLSERNYTQASSKMLSFI
jgi:hypothetical protein